MKHTHGWDVALVCDRCGHEGVPAFGGWHPRWAIRFGKAPTIFAILHCDKCHADLREVAGQRLVELFGATRLSSESRKLVTVSAGLVVAMTVLIVPAFLVWGWRAWMSWLVLGIAGSIAPLAQWISNRLMARPGRCDCGRPEYKFMGMLGRSLCYRCTSCGRLLRILT